MNRLTILIYIFSIILNGCTFVRQSEPIKFIGSDYVSYQYDDIRVYIPYYSEKRDSIDSCEPRKQLEFLFDSGVINGFQFAELFQQKQQDDSFLKKSVNDLSNHDKCIDDYEDYKGRIIFLELVFFDKINDDQKKILNIYVNTTGWSSGPILQYQIEIISKGLYKNCIDNLIKANSIKLEYFGLQL